MKKQTINDKKMNKIYILSFIILVIIAILLARLALFHFQSQNLNVLLISIDTLRPDHMGVYGYPKLTTPSIDKWAKDALVFSNATTVVPMTHPSFTALMTGRSPFESRIVTNGDPGLSPNNKSLATRLYERGYTTSAFITSESVLSQGFEKIDYQYYKYYYYEDSDREKYGHIDEKTSDRLVQEAEKWMINNKNKKFFTWVHLTDPHAPYYPAKELRCKFDTEYCSQINGKSLKELEELRAEFQSCQKSEIPKNRIKLMETLYDGGIASADKRVGEIIKMLEKQGLSKNTMVILYGDHGEGFDHNYYFNHREVLYDSSIKIPLIIKDPRVSKKGIVKRKVQNIDFLPTLLDLLRIPEGKPNLTGKSFASEFYPVSIPMAEKRYSYFVNSKYTKFAISDGRYKYIYSLPNACLFKGQIEELYDLKNDPEENINLHKKNAEIASKLKQKLDEYLGKYNLPLFPKKNDLEEGVVPKERMDDVMKELKEFQY